MKYLVQAILIDDTGRYTIETVTSETVTDDYQRTLNHLMRKYKNSNKYRFTVVEIETQEIVVSIIHDKYYYY